MKIERNEVFLMLLQAVIIGYLQKSTSHFLSEDEYTHTLFLAEQFTMRAMKKLTKEE